uniref:Uncharacterized protein n=1 Tax=Oryza meridionalis TaxID=40149 RepID=A0A0E0EN81_9ORYZ
MSSGQRFGVASGEVLIPRGLGAPNSIADVEHGHGVPIGEGARSAGWARTPSASVRRPPSSGGEVVLAQGKYHASVLCAHCAAKLDVSYSNTLKSASEIDYT